MRFCGERSRGRKVARASRRAPGPGGGISELSRRNKGNGGDKTAKPNPHAAGLPPTKVFDADYADCPDGAAKAADGGYEEGDDGGYCRWRGGAPRFLVALSVKIC